MKIGLVANRDHPQVQNIIREIKKRDHYPALIRPHEIIVDYNKINYDYDLYAVKVKSSSSLHSIAIAEEQGIPTVNKSDSIRITQDKILCDIMLRKNNIPIPRTYFTESIESLKELNGKLKFPIVVKPYNGSDNEATKVEDFEELITTEYDNLLYFQEFVANDGLDRKIYVVGEEVFGIKRPSPLIKTYEKKSEEERDRFTVPEHLEDTVKKIGEIFDLSIYGIDVLPVNGHFVVLDVNDFPGFRGVKEAGKAIANCLINAAKK